MSTTLSGGGSPVNVSTFDAPPWPGRVGWRLHFTPEECDALVEIDAALRTWRALPGDSRKRLLRVVAPALAREVAGEVTP